MKMRYLPLALALVFSPVIAAHAQISVAIGLPGVNIGISMPMYPQLVQVPGYPVYYDPQASSNYFFYDGAYWVYQRDNWYASTWYNGPWQEVDPESVPRFVLRIPVRYYREPPTYFRGWSRNEAPRWGDHWGQSWSLQHQGWDQWNRNSAPAAAPLPTYQRQYAGARYPRTVAQRTSIRTQNYRYQPREAVTRQIQQHSATRFRADAQARNASARQHANAQHTQKEQRAQAQQTKQHAQAQRAQKVQRAQTRQRAQAQQTEKRAQAQRAQTVRRAQTQQRAQAQAQAQHARQLKPQSKRPVKAAPKKKDKKAQGPDHSHGGGRAWAVVADRDLTRLPIIWLTHVACRILGAPGVRYEAGSVQDRQTAQRTFFSHRHQQWRVSLHHKHTQGAFTADLMLPASDATVRHRPALRPTAVMLDQLGVLA